MDYKEKDRKSILSYIEQKGGEVSVEEIIANSGADRFRVYPIIFEEIYNKKLNVVEEYLMGTPKIVRLL